MGIGRVRGVGFLTKKVLILKVVKMVEKSRKESGGVLVPTLMLVLLIIQVTDVIMELIIFRHRVANLMQAEVTQFFYCSLSILWLSSLGLF